MRDKYKMENAPEHLKWVFNKDWTDSGVDIDKVNHIKTFKSYNEYKST
jgi:hypothetical protein